MATPLLLLLFLSACSEPKPSLDQQIRSAEAYLDSGQIQSAITVLTQLEQEYGHRVDILEPLAFAYSASDDHTMAALTFSRIAELAPNRPEYLLYAATALLEGNDRKGAVARFRAYLQKEPDDRAIWVTLAEIEEKSGNRNKALEAYLAAENIQPRPAQQFPIGQLYLRAGNLPQAQRWFARAADQQSDYRDQALLGLLETSIRAERYADAEDLVTKLDVEFPGQLDQSHLASTRAQLQQWRQRQEAARQAAADLADQSDQSDTSDQSEPPSHLATAREFRQQGDWEAAVQHYRQALLRDDASAEVWAELSEAYLALQNHDWARATASEAMRRQPDNPRWQLQYLRAAQPSLSNDQFLRELEDAHRRFPEFPRITLVLARAYDEAGNRRNARLLYSEFLEAVGPDHQESPQVQQRLQTLAP